MSKKFYAVVKENGENCICNSWSKCSKIVSGQPNVKYKKFSNKNQAEEFIKKILDSMKPQDTKYRAYVDGSYNTENNMYGVGLIVLKGDEEVFRFKDAREDKTGERNINGELVGALYAMQCAVKANLKEITIVHDYAGISNYTTGAYKAETKLAQFYVSNYEKYSKDIKIYFEKVKGHSNDHWNDEVDLLAKSACGIK